MLSSGLFVHLNFTLAPTPTLSTPALFSSRRKILSIFFIYELFCKTKFSSSPFLFQNRSMSGLCVRGRISWGKLPYEIRTGAERRGRRGLQSILALMQIASIRRFAGTFSKDDFYVFFHFFLASDILLLPFK